MMFGSFRDLAFMGAALKAAPVVPWTPAEITTALWLDAADSSTITVSSGLVSQWRDKSGNATHASQSTSSLQPMLNASPARLTFSEDGMVFPVPVFPATGNWSLLIVWNSAQNAFAPLFSQNNTNDSAGRGYILPRGLGGANIQFRIGNPFYDSIDRGPNGTQAIAFIQRESSTIRFRKNGGAQDSTTNSAAIDNAVTGMGGRLTSGSFDAFYSGSVSEIVLVNSAIGTTDRQKLEGYLAHKWGLTADLPSDHPYKNSPPTI